MDRLSIRPLLCIAVLALAACEDQRQGNVDPSTNREETEQLVAAMQNRPEVAPDKMRNGPDTDLLPAPTGPAPDAHGNHAAHGGSVSSHSDHR